MVFGLLRVVGCLLAQQLLCVLTSSVLVPWLFCLGHQVGSCVAYLVDGIVWLEQSFIRKTSLAM